MSMLITDYLDRTVDKFPDKVAFADDRREMTFFELQREAKLLAACIVKKEIFKKPIVVFIDKSPECVAAFMGVAYSGNYYTPMDTSMPQGRIDKILDILQPAAIITNEKYFMQVGAMVSPHVQLISYEVVMETHIDSNILTTVRDKIIDTDIMYVLFTSGSTGEPKGVIVSHRSVVDHADWAAETFGFSHVDVFANQSPFYFDHSILELFQTIRNGASLYIVPKMLFSFPKKLMNFLEERKVNALIWVPSILCLLANFKAVEKYPLSNLKYIMFGGEVMPVPQLNVWRRQYPKAIFVNLYGPTEATDDSTYYVISREFSDDDVLPIGNACHNMHVFLLDEEDNLVTEPGIMGELCVRGTGLSYGYYRNEEKTREAFVQNPLHNLYEEKIYRTGDLAKYNDFGEIMYLGRKDFQIKHMGRRIELGEIEAAAIAVKDVESVCCIYDDEKKQIVMFYVGHVELEHLQKALKNTLQEYMMPGRVIQLKQMPLNLNGKIDRKQLKGDL